MRRPPLPSLPSSLPILLVLATVALLVVFPVGDFDIFWHLANGRAMLERGAIINQEIFSYTANGKPFSNHAWLSQILFFLIFKTLGANGLIAVKVMITTIIALALTTFSRRRGCSPLLTALVCLLTFGASIFRYVERPELFSALFLTLTGILLFSYRANASAKTLAPLPLIMALWDVTHGALYGLIFLIAFILGETLKALLPTLRLASPPMPRRQLQTLWLWFAITIIIMLLSPYGLRSYDIFLEFVNNNTMTSMTAEFQPSTLAGQPLFWGMLALTTATLLAAGRGVDLTSLALLIPFATLAIRYVRGIGPFSLVAALLLAVNLPPLLTSLPLDEKGRRRLNGLSLLVLISGLGYALYYKFSPPPRYDSFGLGISDDAFPVGSTRFIKAVNLSGNLYNTDRYGGYLAYYLFPQRKIFHYNHHILFDALERYVHEPESRAQWQINYAIIGRSDEWDMFSRDGFVPVYWEPTGAVMLKDNEQNRDLIRRYAIRYFSPVMPSEALYDQAKNPLILPTLAREISDYLTYRQDPEKVEILTTMLKRQKVVTPITALELLTRAEPYNTNSPNLAAAIGTLCYQLGQVEQAKGHLELALQLAPKQVEARFSLAYLLYDQKRYQEAANHFQEILRLTPRHPDTLYGLGLCLYQLGRTLEANRAFQGYLDLLPQGPWAEKARNFILDHTNGD